jgi:hypothetical protein
MPVFFPTLVVVQRVFAPPITNRLGTSIISNLCASAVGISIHKTVFVTNRDSASCYRRDPEIVRMGAGQRVAGENLYSGSGKNVPS